MQRGHPKKYSLKPSRSLSKSLTKSVTKILAETQAKNVFNWLHKKDNSIQLRLSHGGTNFVPIST